MTKRVAKKAQVLYEGSMRLVLEYAMPKSMSEQIVYSPLLKDTHPSVIEAYHKLLTRINKEK